MIQPAKGSVSKQLRLDVDVGEDAAEEEEEAVDQSLVINHGNEVFQIRLNSNPKAIQSRAKTIKMLKKMGRVKLVRRIPLKFKVKKQNRKSKFKVSKKNR